MNFSKLLLESYDNTYAIFRTLRARGKKKNNYIYNFFSLRTPKDTIYSHYLRVSRSGLDSVMQQCD